ncbi:C-type lectin domain family 1 member B-like isoform X2 [Petaurus breviceps papuanus]|uniref:C-type lectin domain family 1 member B-like isoform X2 n=1 Tax=Petaurus breviceps papuanus TaxID=3040969 RepID=UPI0036DC338E
MQDEDGYITLNFKSRTSAVTSGLAAPPIPAPPVFKQQDNLHTQNGNLSEILQKVAKNFCQEFIQKSVGNPCNTNWRHHGDRCYGFFRQNLTWAESKQYCAKRNATLLKITNQDTLDFLKGRTTFIRWIGLSRRKSDGIWIWEDGSPFSKSVFKLLGNGEDQHCTYFHKGKIYTSLCEVTHYLMCEQKANTMRIEQLITGKTDGEE